MRFFFIAFSLLVTLASAHAQTPLEGTPITDRADLPHADGFVSRGESVELLLNAIGAAARQPVVVSTQARKKRVSGNFNLARPTDTLSKVSADAGLVWYSDGQSIYVYDATEQKNAVGRLRSTSLATLTDFLRKARLADARYPVRGGGAVGTFYVAGPPVYVDIVLNAARYLDDLYEGADASPHHVEVIRLEHSFVNGRRYGLRTEETVLPGVAEVLAGKDSGWDAQQRDDGGVSWLALARGYGGLSVFGLFMGALAYAVSPSLAAWMAPVVIGMVLAIPVVGFTSSRTAGVWMHRLGLMEIPEESAPPKVLVRAAELRRAAAEAHPAG